jgi:hypothetical protein
MTAQEHLNPIQFMSLADIGKLRTTLGEGTVDDNLPGLEAQDRADMPTYMSGMREHLLARTQRQRRVIRGRAATSSPSPNKLKE